MPMLAERKKKIKWLLLPKGSPNKPIWDSGAGGLGFGQKLMEKMGWSSGKGLGVKEQGIQEPLRVSYKNDTKGMGYKLNQDEWIEQQDEFNDLLQELSNGIKPDFKEADFQKTEVNSLEEKSKKSKNRVHYQKFTRGKDLSRYSENDLACILGTNRSKAKAVNHPKESNKKDVIPENCKDETFGVTTIFGGSMVNYFSTKLSKLNKKNEKTEVISGDLMDKKVMRNDNQTSFSCDEFVKHKAELKEGRVKKSKFATPENINFLVDKIEENIDVNDYKCDKEVKKDRKNCKKKNIEFNSDLTSNLSDEISINVEEQSNTEMVQSDEIQKISDILNDQTSNESCIPKKKKKKSVPDLTDDSKRIIVNLAENNSKHKKSKKKEKHKFNLEFSSESKDFTDTRKSNKDSVIENMDDEPKNKTEKKRRKKEEKLKTTKESMEVANSVNEDSDLHSFVHLEEKGKKTFETTVNDEFLCEVDHFKNCPELQTKSKKKKLKCKTEELYEKKIEEKEFNEIHNFDVSEMPLKDYNKKKKKKRKKDEHEIDESLLLKSTAHEDETHICDLVPELFQTNLLKQEAVKQKKKKSKHKEKSDNQNDEVDLGDLNDANNSEKISKKRKRKRSKESPERDESPKHRKHSSSNNENVKNKKLKKSVKNDAEETEFVDVSKLKPEIEQDAVSKPINTFKDDSGSTEGTQLKKNDKEFIEQNIYHSHKLGIIKKEKKPFNLSGITSSQALSLYCGAEVNKFIGSSLASLEGYGKLTKRANTY